MFELPELSYECKNLLSARNQFETTTELLNVELERGYVIGPFNQIPYEHYRISPLGVAESKYSKKKRLIFDPTAPHDNEMHPSFNQLINKENFTVSYVKIDNKDYQRLRRRGIDL